MAFWSQGNGALQGKTKIFSEETPTRPLVTKNNKIYI